jgi:outer membrane protein TolC
MKIMRTILTFAFLYSCLFLYGQDTVRLATCYEKAILFYPVARDKKLNEQLSDLKIKNITTSWYPQLSLGAQATYQSDVTHVSIPPLGPGLAITIPEPRKDQYKMTLDINQTIYDGGYSKSQKALEAASQLTESQQVEIELYQLKDRINGVFFSISLIDANIKLILSAKQSIDEKLNSVESAVRNGTMTNPDKDVLLAESLKFEEKLFELNEDRQTMIKNLSELTGEKYSAGQKFVFPDVVIPDTTSATRPEMQLYDLQMRKLDASIKVIDSRTLPRMSVFSQLGYGNPGLNMLSDKFASYGIIGASIKWNFWDWNSGKRDKEALLIQKDIIADKKSVFELNRNIALKSELSSIQKFQKSFEMNTRLVELRKNITHSSASRLSSGSITSSDYVSDLNSQVQAELNLELSRISLIQSVINFANISGEK